MLRRVLTSLGLATTSIGCGLLLDPTAPPLVVATDVTVVVTLDATTDRPQIDRPPPDRPDAPRVDDAPDVADATDATDIADLDVGETSDAAEVFDAGEAFDVTGLDAPAMDASDVTLVAGDADVPEVSRVDVDERRDVPDVFSCPSAPRPGCTVVPPRTTSPWSGASVSGREVTLRWVGDSCGMCWRVNIYPERDSMAPATTFAVSGSTRQRDVTLPSSAAGRMLFWEVVLETATVRSARAEFRLRRLSGVTSRGGVWGTTPDINGDGLADLVIARSAQSPAAVTGEGCAWTIPGARAPIAADLSMRPCDHAPDMGDARSRATFGARLMGAGDVDGNGIPDLLVGSHGRNAWIFRAPANGERPGAPIVLERGAPEVTEAQPAWLAFGDGDGDGFTDIAAGRAGPTLGGVLRVWSGGTSTSLAFSDTRAAPALAGLGGTLSSAGDIDADGRGEFVAGENNLVGASSFWLRPSSLGTFLRAQSGTGVTAPFGSSELGAVPGAVADLDGDGRAEALLSVPSANPIWFASLRGSTSFEAAPLPGSFDADHRPFPIGDFNGDGFDDVGVYAPMSNRVYVMITGRSGMSTTTPTLRPTNGIPVNAPVLAFAGIGDFDGDGDDDVAVLYSVIGLAHSVLVYRGGDAPGAAYGPFTLPALPERSYAIASAW